MLFERYIKQKSSKKISGSRIKQELKVAEKESFYGYCDYF